MVNRISTSSKYSQLVLDMQRNMYKYDKLTKQIASGKKIMNITDDPLAAVNILNTNRQLGQIDTFTQNVQMASKELGALDDFFDLAGGYLTEAWDKAIQANNQTYGKTSLEALKVEIDEITKTMVDLANSEYNDNYIFGGANTKITPYVMEDNGDIIYRGTMHDNPDYIRQTEVADGVFEVINTTGDKVFGWYKDGQAQTSDGKNIFLDVDGKEVIETINPDDTKTYNYENGDEYTGDVADLTEKGNYSGVLGALRVLSDSIQDVIDAIDLGDKDALEAGYEKMRSTLDMFGKSHTEILNEQTKFGGVFNRMEMTSSTLETSGENLTGYLSQLQDIDLSQAITDWYMAQYAYQASLQVSAQSLNMSLLNYM